MTPPSIRAQMLQRAAHLLNSTQNEEAWHLVGLYQQTQPRGFLHICHRILASFLELTHDYFDQGWPLSTRLARMTPSSASTNGSLRSRRLRRQRVKTTSDMQNCWSHDELDDDQPLVDAIDLTSVYHNHMCMSPVDHHVTYCTALIPTGPNGSDTTPKHLTGLGKLRSTLAAKRLFKQILPSRPRTPSTAKLACLDHAAQQRHLVNTPTSMCTPNSTVDATSRMHTGSVVSPARIGTRTPLAPIHTARNTTRTGPWSGHRHLPAQSRTLSSNATDSCCNTDSLICRSLIEYMLDNPALCETEGLFRIPGNAQRIRDLWLSLRGFFQTPYVRIPQPEPESNGLESDVMSTRWDLYSLLDAYSPHDLATLLLRCLTTCSQSAVSTNGNGSMSASGGCMGASHGTGSVGVSGSNLGSTGGASESIRNSFPFFNPDDNGLDSSAGGLIHPEAGELCFLATQLQYGLEQVRESDLNEDWMHMLCQARQLLTYRIVLQLLLPNPERVILFDLLRLFRQVSRNQTNSRMSAECLARCTAVAIFGPPTQIHTNPTGQHPHSWSVDSPLRWRIDTLTNLIQMANDLDQLPGVVYGAVRDRLRARLGHSPIARVHVAHTDGVSVFPRSTRTPSASSSMRYFPLGSLSAAVNADVEDPNDSNTTVTHSKPVEVVPRCEDPSLVQGSSARASLHRAKSSLDPGSRQRGARVNGSTEPFKLWRRQKAGHVTSATASVTGAAMLTKARSVMLFSPQKMVHVSHQ